jgi:hypothetical protein
MLKFSLKREREREYGGGGVIEQRAMGQRAKKSVIRSFVVSQSESELNSECCCDYIGV